MGIMSAINKKALEHLAALARIELHKHEEEKLLKDLEKILAHFEELKELKTENVVPMAGGTELKSITREDGGTAQPLSADAAADAFPEKERRYLKIPPVFE